MVIKTKYVFLIISHNTTDVRLCDSSKLLSMYSFLDNNQNEYATIHLFAAFSHNLRVQRKLNC